MQKCRLCLVSSKNVKCLFDIDNNLGISYAEIINSFVNVKVSKCDGITIQICLSCRRKTTDLWDFKLKVERSQIALQENSPLKRVHFNNIYDVEFTKIVIEKGLRKPIPIEFTNSLKKDGEPYTYNDTLIKKVTKNVKEPIAVMDFLNSIKEKSEQDFQYDSVSCSYKDYEVEIDYDLDLHHDPDYKVHQPPKKKVKNPKKNKENKQWETILEKPIKPVFLADFLLVPTKIAPRKQKNKDKYRICPYCGKTFKDRYINKHMLYRHSDKRPFECEKCSKAFVSEESLRCHFKKVHGSKEIKCDQCTASFTGLERLNNHMMNRHCTERKFVCDACNKGFKTRYHLSRHIQHVHNLGPKPFKCELCPDTFSSIYILRHHLRVHTKERPYNCEMCSQPYSYKRDFNRHCFKKHGVWLYRRTVHVMNEQVLAQERVLMRDMLLRLNGILKDDKPVNPFEGHETMAFDLMVKAIESGKLVVDLQL